MRRLTTAILSLIGRKKPEPKKPCRYAFHDGIEAREVAPLEVISRFLAQTTFRNERHAGLLESALSGAIEPNPHDAPRVLEALAEWSKAIRVCFDVPAEADGGLSDAQCLSLLEDFERFAQAHSRQFLLASPKSHGCSKS